MKRRLRSIEEAFGYKEFWKQISYFMGSNNFSGEEIAMVMHLMNSLYFMGADLEKCPTDESTNSD